MTAPRRTGWIRCSLEPGMFPTEYAAKIDGSRGVVSLFIDKHAVQLLRGQTHLGQLRVFIVESNSINGEDTVLLPTETLENGSRWVTVPAADVHADQ